MYKLSTLPIEILYLVGNFLDIEDLVTLARLNTWYGYWISIILGERIDQCVQNEGWRIHMDILAKSYSSFPSFPFSTELLLLSEYSKINPYTLSLEFNLCPINEDGLDAVKSAAQSERSIVLFDKIKTNIDIVAYFAQISTNRRLQHVNQAGAAIINDRNLWNQLIQQDTIHGIMVVTGSAFRLQYKMTAKDNDSMTKIIYKFHTDYNQHKGDLNIQNEKPAIISFDKIQVSPEWWIKQMKVSTYSSSEQQYPELSEHGYW